MFHIVTKFGSTVITAKATHSANQIAHPFMPRVISVR